MDDRSIPQQYSGRRGGGGHTPLAVLESLVALQAVAAEPWRAPVARIQTMCIEPGLRRAAPVLLGRWWAGPGLVLFVDGAHDGPSWRMGGFSEFLGVRSYVARRLRAQSQQLVELQSLFWGVRLAVALGYTTVTLVSDLEVAIAQFLQVRAKSVLGAQQTILRGLARSLVCSGLVVRVLWVADKSVVCALNNVYNVLFSYDSRGITTHQISQRKDQVGYSVPMPRTWLAAQGGRAAFAVLTFQRLCLCMFYRQFCNQYGIPTNHKVLSVTQMGPFPMKGAATWHTLTRYPPLHARVYLLNLLYRWGTCRLLRFYAEENNSTSANPAALGELVAPAMERPQKPPF